MSGEALPDASRPGASGRGAAGPILKAVISHRWVVMLVALATVAGAVAYLSTRKPQYKADVRLLFTPLQSGDGAQGRPLVVASADPTRDAQTAATLLRGPRAAALAAQRLGHGWTPQRVAQAASVVQVGESNVIVVEATAPSVGQATRVATA